jgi:hypothetical protein
MLTNDGVSVNADFSYEALIFPVSATDDNCLPLKMFSHSCVGVVSLVPELKNAPDADEYRKHADRLNDKVKN